MPHSNSEEIPRLGVGSRQINGVEYSSKRIGSLPDVFCFRITRSAKAKQRRGQRPNQRSWRPKPGACEKPPRFPLGHRNLRLTF